MALLRTISIAQIANNDDPNLIEGLQSNHGFTQAVSEDGTQRWNYLPNNEKGSKWVIQSVGGVDNSYSTEETLTGETWKDGKPIYRKCFDVTNNIEILQNLTKVDLDNLIENFETPVNIFAISSVTKNNDVIFYDTRKNFSINLVDGELVATPMFLIDNIVKKGTNNDGTKYSRLSILVKIFGLSSGMTIPVILEDMCLVCEYTKTTD